MRIRTHTTPHVFWHTSSYARLGRRICALIPKVEVCELISVKDRELIRSCSTVPETKNFGNARIRTLDLWVWKNANEDDALTNSATTAGLRFRIVCKVFADFYSNLTSEQRARNFNNKLFTKKNEISHWKQLSKKFWTKKCEIFGEI